MSGANKDLDEGSFFTVAFGQFDLRFSSMNDATLQDAASDFAAGRTSLWQATDAALGILIDRVGCLRVSLWKFDGLPDGRVLNCFAAKASGSRAIEVSESLTQEQYQDYFSALIRTTVFVSNDARADPRLVAMRGDYLEKYDVGALLDVLAAVNGRAYGIACCEYLGRPRDWNGRDIATARAMISFAMRLLASEPSLNLQSHFSVPIGSS